MFEMIVYETIKIREFKYILYLQLVLKSEYFDFFVYCSLI